MGRRADRPVDLNLLRVFAAVYEAPTVTEAAVQLHMAQPSVTQALNRLRAEAGDPLFVRSGRGLVPTRAAKQLYAAVGDMPAAAEAALHSLSEFVPGTTRETFRLALTDVGQTLFLPTLGPELMRIAPQSRLDVVNLDADRAPAALRVGEVDLAVSSTLLAADLRAAMIREDLYCCIARRGRFSGRTPTLSEVSVLPRIVMKGSIGHTLIESGFPPPIAGSISLPAFSAIPAVLASSDLIAFVPHGVLPCWTEAWDLEAWPLPADQFTSRVRAHTAPRPLSAASAWFTEWTIATLRGVPDPPPTGNRIPSQ